MKMPNAQSVTVQEQEMDQLLRALDGLTAGENRIVEKCATK